MGESPCKPKILNIPLLLNITPTKKLSPPVPWSQIAHWKKKGFNNFWTDFIKNSAQACIFSNTIMTCLKKLIGTKFQQDYLPELLPIVLLNIYGKPYRWGESHPTAKSVLIYPTWKITFMKFTLLSKVSFLPHEIVFLI